MLADRRAARLGSERALVAAAVLVALATGCANIEPMRADLDTLELPPGLVQFSERTGPETCFAGDCPWVHRRYATGRPLEDVCADMRAAVEAWGVTDARWRIGESDLNPCTASARRDRYWVSVAVFDFDRLSVGEVPADVPADARRTVVSIGLRLPP